jgi:regulator of chromosome condensation
MFGCKFASRKMQSDGMDIDNESEVYVCGSGECEQLGIPDVFEARTPRPLKFPEPIHSVSCGGMHTAALTREGRVYTWGCNDDGALGRSGIENCPGLVTGIKSVNQVSTGDSHTLALNSEHKILYMWGAYRDSSGNMKESARFPLQIDPTEFGKCKTLHRIASGANHSLVLADDKVFAWGDSESGQIARQPKSRRKKSQSLQIESIGVKNVKDIFCGAYHSFILLNTGKVLGWGLNNRGQLGDGTITSTCTPHEIPELSTRNIKSITAGENHSIALTDEGKILVWGRNDDFQLGLQNDVEMTTPQELTELEQIKAIAAGSHFNYAINNAGQAYSWGYGECFVLGNGREDSVDRPTVVNWSNAHPLVQISAGSQHVAFLVKSTDLQLPEIEEVPLKRKRKTDAETHRAKRVKL